MLEAAEESPSNDDICSICDQPGILICCEVCVHSYHFECANFDEEEFDDAVFTCKVISRHCTNREELRTLDEISEDPGVSGNMEWIGSARNDGSNSHYNGFRRANYVYNIGSCVQIDSGCSDIWLAMIDSLWQDKHGQKWVRLIWFYTPEQTKFGRLPEHHQCEIFLSTLIDSNLCEVIIRPVLVVPLKVFVAIRNALDSTLELGQSEEVSQIQQHFPDASHTSALFFCERKYNCGTGEFRALIDRPCIMHPLTACPQIASILAEFRNLTFSDGPATAARKNTQNSGIVSAGSKRRHSTDVLSPPRTQLKMLSKSEDPIPSIESSWIPDSESGPSSIFARTRATLQVNAAPDCLPCREKEHNEIMTFVSQGLIRGGSSSSMYIAGMPGTGKTASVRQVIKELKSQNESVEIPFEAIEINCMKLPEPHHVYSVLWHSICKNCVGSKSRSSKTVIGSSAAAGALENFFRPANPNSLKNRPILILVLDEIDYLLTSKQSVLYNLLHWPTSLSSRLIVIGISNTLDFSDRLVPRVRSRLGMNRITFAPYSRQQLQQILDQRLNIVNSASFDSCGRGLFHPDALELCARKVAALSGDARRALQICRRAVEICESESVQLQSLENSTGKNLVEMKHIDRAVKELFSSPFTPFIQLTTFHEKLCLLGCLLESRMNSSNFISVVRLHERYSNLCSSIHSGGIPQSHEFSRIVSGLCNSGLVVFENTGSGRGIGSDLGIGTPRTGREHGDELVTTSPILRLVVVHEDIVYSLHGESQLMKFLPNND